VRACQQHTFSSYVQRQAYKPSALGESQPHQGTHQKTQHHSAQQLHVSEGANHSHYHLASVQVTACNHHTQQQTLGRLQLAFAAAHTPALFSMPTTPQTLLLLLLRQLHVTWFNIHTPEVKKNTLLHIL
jgi:hypothetical protein